MNRISINSIDIDILLSFTFPRNSQPSVLVKIIDTKKLLFFDINISNIFSIKYERKKINLMSTSV